MDFFAHSTQNPDRSDWQSLAEHLIAVGHLAADKASRFGAAEYGRAAGLLHDLGKYTERFQAMIAGANYRVDHSTWGARIAVERYGAVGKLLAYSIAGHHAGLANGRESGQRSALSVRLESELPELMTAWQREIALPPPEALAAPEGFRPVRRRSQFQLAFLARMIFSCLVDADFLDTEAFYNRIEGRENPRGKEGPRLGSLREALDQYLARFRADSPVNELRAEILRHVRLKAELEPGLFSLTVPTGGGKTLASMAFALDHAIRHGLRRVIYVVPFTSVVEQNAAEFRNAFGPLGKDAVLEHHSAFVDRADRALESKDKLKLAMENWDRPVVATTAVQFFESLFADRPAKCRKLHNIAGSVIILDEAQVMPLKLLRPCVTALDELALNYRVSIVLCTATQPALKAPEFEGGLENVRELTPDPVRLFRALKRTRVRHLEQLSDAEIADHLSAREQVLCIVNNRRHARELYRIIEHLPGACHLSTLMCAQHRGIALAEIKRRLADNQPCRLVATSLIEAGVDVDFPTVLRAEAGLDSVAQAAGRCNREGKRPVEASELLIFAPDNQQWKPPRELIQFAQVAHEVLRHHGDDPLSLAAVERYFRLLYWRSGADDLDYYDLLGLIRDGGLDGLPFETVASKFKMIESAQRPVIVPFDDTARSALRDLSFADRAGAIARRLQPYLVQLPFQGFDALYRSGAIQPVAPEKFAEQFMQLVNGELYDFNIGLTWDDPVFMSAEALVI